MKITGISSLKDCTKLNLFSNSYVASKKEELLKEGLVKFQIPLNISKNSVVFIDWTISVVNTGYLAQIQDITESKSEEPLKSEDKYRRWFEDDLTGDFIATPDGEILECNPAFAEIYGFDNYQKAAKTNICDFNPDDWVNLVTSLKREYKIYDHQSWHRRPDGVQIHVVANVVGIFDDLDELVQVKGYVFDDTERKQAEEYLRDSEEKYRLLFDEDLTGDFIATPDGEILECNPAFAEIYGFDKCQNAVKSNVSQFNPEDWINLIKHLKTESKIQDHQIWHRRLDGEYIHVVANVVGIFDDLDELVQVKGYVFDDTERKQAEEYLRDSEEKYRLLFDEDLTGDFIATPDGEILECNPAFAEIYGFDNCDMALEWNILESNPFDWPYMVTRIKKERKIQGYQSWQRRSDGMRIHVVANVVGIFDDSNELVQVKGYVFDDTERKNAEERLTNSKRQITEILDSIQDNFIALNHYWNFIYVNKCAAEYFGVEADDLMGQNLWERFPELVKTRCEEIFRRTMETNEIQHFEAPSIHKTGQWFDFSVYPSSEGISVYWRDITGRKNLEK